MTPTCLFSKTLYMIQTLNINSYDKIYSFYITLNFKKKLFIQNERFVMFFSFLDNNKNLCGKITNIFVMRAVDHEQKI